MTNQKTPEEIAELSCQFANYYFDDGAVPLPASLLAKRSEIRADRKVLTRLVPRFVAAHSYFGGYNDAQNELFDRLASAQESERSVCEHAKQLEAEIEVLKKERDELRLNIASITSPSLEDVHRLADIAHVEYKRWKQGWHGVVTAIVVELAKSNQANIGIVVKPPPPPPPPVAPAPMTNELSTEIDDELAQSAADYANLVSPNTRLPGLMNDVHDAKTAVSHSVTGSWSDAVRSFVAGTRWQLAQIERTHVGEYLDENDKSIPTDAHLQAMKEYVSSKTPDIAALKDLDWPDLAVAVTNMVGEAFLGGARPNGESMAAREALVDMAERLGCGSLNTTMAVEQLMQQIGEYVEYLREYQPKKHVHSSLCSCTPTEPIVFRSDDEREYWDSMTFMLARKGDTTAQNVTSAADEMVYERRARMPSVGTENVVQRAFDVANLLRSKGIQVAAVNHMVDDQSRTGIAFGHDQKHIAYIDCPRHVEMSITDIVVDMLGDVFAEMSKGPEQATEVTDELLLEACRFVADMRGKQEPFTVEQAKRALVRAFDERSIPEDWIVTYVGGALRKARKP
jgi:hypothetical protein